LSSSRSRVAGRLTRALTLRIHANEASPLISVSIAGVENQMADIASRTFSRNAATSATFQILDDEFLRSYAESFPLQKASWSIFRMSAKLSLWIFSELRGKTSMLGTWLQLTAKGSAIGTFGLTTLPPSMTWTSCSPRCQTPSALNSFSASLAGSGGATTWMALKSELALFRSRFVPLARSLNWLDSKTPPTKVKESTGSNYTTKFYHLVAIGTTSKSDKVQASCDMCTIAFYYLLRVGEYTGHSKKARQRTKQFRACDIIFYDAYDTIIPNTAPLLDLYSATTAVMRITNQKNGTRGSRISHTTSGTKACPVRALARRVHYIMDHPGAPSKTSSAHISPLSQKQHALYNRVTSTNSM
jgi:hypothetical protein